MRNSIQDFSLANPIYVGATVTVWTVSAGVKTATKATLYAGATGTATLANPQSLDSDGKFQQPVYVDQSVVVTVSGLSIADHDTGIINSVLAADSVADVLADLASTASGKGAGLSGFSHAATYDADTIGAKLHGVVSVKDHPYLAVGNGTNDDLASILAAVGDLPADGGTIHLPAGQFRVSGPILDSGKRVRFIMDAGCVIKPTVDTDVFRLTARSSSVIGQGVIDGSLVGTGNGNGVVVGYGGADAAQVDIACRIDNMRGWGIRYENGAFLKTDVLITNCAAGGILCTETYDDNNHGDFLAHISNCTGPGFRTAYSATLANRSRHHNFRMVKAFGCDGGGFDIDTEQSIGHLFAELNTGTQVNLGANAWGNILFITGANGEPDVTESVAGSNFIFGPQGGGFNYAVLRNLVAQSWKVRDRTNTGSINLAMTAANQATLTNADVANTDFTLKLHNKDYAGGYNFITEVDKLSFVRGGGTIDRMATALVDCAFGTVAAHSTVAVSTGYTTGAGASCIVTWADTAANLPAGIVLQPAIDYTSGTLSIAAINTTGAGIVVGTARIRYANFTHF